MFVSFAAVALAAVTRHDVDNVLGPDIAFYPLSSPSRSRVERLERRWQTGWGALLADVGPVPAEPVLWRSAPDPRDLFDGPDVGER